jgi:hypothetical protein
MSGYTLLVFPRENFSLVQNLQIGLPFAHVPAALCWLAWSCLFVFLVLLALVPFDDSQLERNFIE